jgi:uncharacterized membrane protein
VADRVNQTVLGVFIGTFTYTLLVLRTIHSESQDRVAFVPHVGVTIALLLLLVSIGALIVFINHAAQSIQASVILHREARRTLEQIDELFPERLGHPAGSADDGAASAAPAGRPAVVVAEEAGYLQSVYAEPLWQLGERCRTGPLTVRMELHVGAFAFPGKPLASVWPADMADDGVAAALRKAFVLGPERTPEQDVEFGLVALSDIAVKALSPGINDPTTATHCIDRLSEVLAALAARRHPDVLRTSPDGTVRLLVRDTPFERAAGLAFDQIRHFGGANPTIAKKLLEVLADLAGVVPTAARRALVGQVDAVVGAARRSVQDPVELEAIERLAVDALAAASADRVGDPVPALSHAPKPIRGNAGA